MNPAGLGAKLSDILLVDRRVKHVWSGIVVIESFLQGRGPIRSGRRWVNQTIGPARLVAMIRSAYGIRIVGRGLGPAADFGLLDKIGLL